MPWTETARRRYCRDELRYASNFTDAEWALIAPFMPAPAPRGRPRSVSLRVIVEAISSYMLSTGCQWRQIPREFAPFTTVQTYFYRFSRDGTLARINQALVAMARERAGRSASPTAGVIDSQPVKTTAAGAPAVLKSIRARDPRLRHVFADGGDAGPKLKGRLEKIGKWTIQIVKCSGTAEGFELLPRRWVVERTFAWLGRCRRLAKDFEATIASATAWVLLAHIRLRTRKIIRQR